ncbi:MAG TPA: nuclear transport factor 2 family protein [Gemmataceae bacterium]|jgi:hypothetical protein|nr:nuclear transport factor 2 family protein [Gemmataceae bacterium]
MRVWLPPLVLAGLLFSTAAAAQPDKERAKLRGELAALEKQVWDAWVRQDADALKNLLAEDYQEIGSPAGPHVARAQALESLANLRIFKYDVDNLELLSLSKDAALLTYRATVVGSFRGQNLSPGRYNVSSAWVNRDGKWLSALRQWTPLEPEKEPPPPTIEAFDLTVGPNSLLYTYKGPAPLEDVRISLTILFPIGRVGNIDRYWATWQPGDVKAIDLTFLARGINEIERIELSGTATMGGKKVLLGAVSRRQK